MTNLRTRIGIATLLMLAVCGTAHGYFNPPVISPASPIAGEPISMQIYGGECDIFEDGPTETDIVREGQSIRITIDGYHADDPILCFPLFATWTYPIGSLPDGAYTLEVIHRYPYPGGPILQSVGMVSFVVANSPTAVPLGGRGQSAVLGALLLLGAACAVRRRYSSQA